MTHPLEMRDYSGRFVFNGLSRTTWTWGILSWEGQQDDRWHILPDGRDVYDALDESGLDALPRDCWIKVTNTGKYADIAWTGAGLFCFVSERFLSVLDAHQVIGYRAIPLEVRPKHGDCVHGYSLLYFDDAESDDVRPYPPGNRFSDRIDASARVAEVLAQAGVTDLEIEDAAERTRLALSML